jgi:RNA polymerase sigma-70 factor (sigma-E family)
MSDPESRVPQIGPKGYKSVNSDAVATGCNPPGRTGVEAVSSTTGWKDAPMTAQGVQMRARNRTRPSAATDVEFADWMAARQARLVRTAYLLTGSQHAAEDLVQTTLTKLYLAWDRIVDHQHVDAYAQRALVNEHRSTWRRASRRPEVLSDAPPETGQPAPQYDGEREVVWQFVQGLPPRQRAVIVLRYYEDLSEAEIADLLGISAGTVKSQASRALAALRQRVPAEEEDR